VVKATLGTIHADCVTLAEALDVISRLVAEGRGGYVVTPNVDHVVLAEEHEGLRAAYRDASLSLLDGKPLFWMSRALGQPVPEKVSGSDLVWPLMERAAERCWRVYFLGGMPGVGEAAREVLLRRLPSLQVVGMDAPPVGFERDPSALAGVLERARASRPDLVLVALGCPKQELFMHAHRVALAPAVALGIGASLDFVSGRMRRAPAWMSRAGLEWLFRLSQDPRRLATRYLVRDPAIVGVFLRMLRQPRAARLVRD
jgi:N-acetylglucosaminyldiphosphoundecaprenol N-acetyl-beta-D-mannosaminyltransferase